MGTAESVDEKEPVRRIRGEMSNGVTWTTGNGAGLPHIGMIDRAGAAGVLDMEQSTGQGEATRVLREQYERMRAMLGPEGESIERSVLR